MASSNFEAALALVLQHEGGYADHPSDPGGATNLGITHTTLAAWRGRAVSKADVRALTRTEAAAIYRKQYWARVRGDDLPSGVDLAVFDFAVNSGPLRAVRALQKQLDVAGDGVIGPITLAAAARADASAVIKAICAGRLGFLRALSHFPIFGRGWTRRVTAVQGASLAMARPSTPQSKENNPMLIGTKALFQSKTIWGALVAIAAQGAAFAGVTISPDAQTGIVDLVLQFAGIAGATIALWGRLTADRRIG